MRSRFLGIVTVQLLFCFLTACTDSEVRLPSEPAIRAEVNACALGVSDAEALALIDELSTAVTELEASGALTSGQANALRTHLSGARKDILRGAYCSAAVKLSTFRTQVRNFVGEGVLTEAQAETLLGGATDVLEGYPHFVSVSAGAVHTCALTQSGSAWCWGNNSFGRLGDGTTTLRSKPTPVAAGLSFVTLSAGAAHTCGLTAAGSVWCWGGPAALGTGWGLGDGTTTFSIVPVLVGPGMNLTFTQLSAGADHTCGVTTNGTGYCWGLSTNVGQLGNGTLANALVPVEVGPGLGIVFSMIDTGEGGFGHFTCGVATDRQAWCWGNNTVFGALGDGSVPGDPSYGYSLWPVPVGPGMNLAFSTVDAGETHACGLTTSGAAYCWGANGAGQLGNGTADFPIGQPLDNTKTHRWPEPVVGGHVFSTIDAGGALVSSMLEFTYRSHTCGVTPGAVALCWGVNWFGQLGDGSTTDRVVPTPVPAVPGGFSKISAGAAHTCGLSTFGRAYCWGYNGLGQLGDGTTVDHSVPKAVRFN